MYAFFKTWSWKRVPTPNVEATVNEPLLKQEIVPDTQHKPEVSPAPAENGEAVKRRPIGLALGYADVSIFVSLTSILGFFGRIISGMVSEYFIRSIQLCKMVRMKSRTPIIMGNGRLLGLTTLVKAGSVFYDIVICDDPEYAKQVVEEVFANRKHHHRDWDDYHVSIHLCFTGDLV
ncbi:hypothetical protein FNV43_RR00665 [Rhamnella rubrinervis]|uniref:Uncharacterized protein n=1 Tax=Rhamnella rubrinervis TaxID=2594499 RepID=A0A8K0MRL5_9ROSA|nr:hypothetical protein FNV43_RR00665 [Rhamnella rubrinervis]